jgi:transcriptional regulator GlxA family with amidase domain
MAMQIVIVVYPGFTALDFIGPYEVLRSLPDAELRFVWHEPGPISADSGVLLVGATHSFDETPSPDIILVPGGMTTMEHARDEKVLDWVRRANETSTWTTSVCSGSVILAAAGLLKDRRATSHWLMLPMLKPFGVEAVGDQRIVHEGKFATAAGVSAGIDLAIWLFGEICGEAKAKAVQLAIEYDPQPQFDSGHVSKASAATKASAIAQLSKETVKQHQLVPSVQLLWTAAIQRARSKGGRKGRRRDRQAVSA